MNTDFCLQYARLTSSPLTTLFTLLSLTHFVLQLSFQAWAFSINVDASSFLSNILTTGGLDPQDNFAVLVPLSESSNGTTELRICGQEEMRSHESIHQCPIVWKGRVDAVSGIGYATATSSATATGTATPVSPDVQVIGFSTSFSTTSAATLANTQIPSTATASDVRVVTPTGTEEANPNDLDSGVSVVGGGLAQQAAEYIYQNLEQRDHDLAKVAPKAIRRRHVPVEAVGNASDGLTSVSLPTFKNLTTGDMGITLSEQCVQMIVWPNQMCAFLWFSFSP